MGYLLCTCTAISCLSRVMALFLRQQTKTILLEKIVCKIEKILNGMTLFKQKFKTFIVKSKCFHAVGWEQYGCMLHVCFKIVLLFDVLLDITRARAVELLTMCVEEVSTSVHVCSHLCRFPLA